MKAKIFTASLIILLLFSSVPAYARTPTFETINDDGYITFSNPNYVLFNTSFYLMATNVGGGPSNWYIEFNNTLPSNAIIDAIYFRYTGYNNLGENKTDIKEFESDSQPSQMADNNANNQIIYTDASNGTNYILNIETKLNVTNTVDLGTDAVMSLQAAIGLNRTYWVIGGRSQATPGNDRIWASEVENPNRRPRLIVYWHLATDTVYGFSDIYYENGTHSMPPINVSAIGTGFNEIFNTSGGTTQYYPTRPTLFTWDAGSGIQRRIYTRGIDENYTITIPDDTFSVYEFTIRDYIGAIGVEDIYIESLRYINGTQTLIERALVEDQINGIGLSLVLYRLYTIRLRYGTTTIDYQFVPGVDTTPTLQLRDFPFSSKAQSINNYITIEATRSANGTIIYGNYEDELNQTNLIEFSVRLLNGTEVHYQNSTNAIVTFVWPAAVNTTDYKVVMSLNHSGFTGIRRFGYVLPGLRNYDAVPDLGLFGSWSNIAGTSILGIALLIIIGSLFSEKYIVAGAFSMVIIAGVLDSIGFINLSYLELVSAALAAAMLSIISWRGNR